MIKQKVNFDLVLILSNQTEITSKLAYQPDELIIEQHPFWDFAGEYTSNNTDSEFISEMAYMMVTLYKSEVS